MLWLKSTSTFEQQTGITLKLVIEKTLCHQMRHRFQHFWRFLSIQIQSQWIKPEIQKRTPNSIHLWSKQILKPIAKISAKSNRKKFQSKTWNTVRKKSFQQRRQLYLSIQWSDRKAASSFNSLCLNNIGAPGQRQVCISKNSIFSGLRSPELQLRHMHGHQHWNALTISINVSKWKTLVCTK